MRNTWSGSNTSCTIALSSRALARSWPNGFSMTARRHEPSGASASPCLFSCWTTFGKNFGGLGHSSHQNGLDADILYPRLDGLERRAWSPELVDEQLSQELLDRFLAAGAVAVYTGLRLDLRGPRKVVVKLAHHDDHMHVRIRG